MCQMLLRGMGSPIRVALDHACVPLQQHKQVGHSRDLYPEFQSNMPPMVRRTIYKLRRKKSVLANKQHCDCQLQVRLMSDKVLFFVHLQFSVWASQYYDLLSSKMLGTPILDWQTRCLCQLPM